jgi:hypothetical protein
MVKEVSVKGEERAAYIHVATDAKRMRGVIHESYRTSHHLQIHSQSMNSLSFPAGTIGSIGTTSSGYGSPRQSESFCISENVHLV